MMRKPWIAATAFCLAGSFAGSASARDEPKPVAASSVDEGIRAPDAVMRATREAVPGFRPKKDGMHRDGLVYTLSGSNAEGRDVQITVTRAGFVSNIYTKVALDELPEELSKEIMDVISDELRGSVVKGFYRHDIRYRFLGLRFQIKGHTVSGTKPDKPDEETLLVAVDGPLTRLR